MAASHFAGHFSAIFGSGPVSHSVAGQPGRNVYALFWILKGTSVLGTHSDMQAVPTYHWVLHFMGRGVKTESPLVYPYPQNTRNSDHGLSFPSTEAQTMV